jgi:hypothetical protein
MNYRGFKITILPDGYRWRIDGPAGFLVTRGTQQAACAWVDRYLAYLAFGPGSGAADKASAEPPGSGYQWRKRRPQPARK